MASHNKDTSPASSGDDPIAMVMSSLLPIHRAMTIEWLVDAAATAAERGLNAPYTFVYLEGGDGRLGYRAPASDLRRRSVQRAIDAFGDGVLDGKLDPAAMPALAEALDARTPVAAPPAEVFRGRMDEETARAAQRALGVEVAAVIPLETAGERIGALVLLLPEAVNAERAKLLADHVACAAVNLRNAEAAREYGVTDIVRSVFDAKKLESDLQRELARAARYKREVSIVVIEATNLWLLRERFGRFLTERLLQRLGESLAQNARDIDTIGAYKESGYTMILAEAHSGGAAVAARRLLATAQETKLDGEDVPGLDLHLVVGWATYPVDGATTDLMFAVAERRMYSTEAQAQVA